MIDQFVKDTQVPRTFWELLFKAHLRLTIGRQPERLGGENVLDHKVRQACTRLCPIAAIAREMGPKYDWVYNGNAETFGVVTLKLPADTVHDIMHAADNPEWVITQFHYLASGRADRRLAIRKAFVTISQASIKEIEAALGA